MTSYVALLNETILDNASIIAGDITCDSVTVNGNITITGSVDGVDVSTLNTQVQNIQDDVDDIELDIVSIQTDITNIQTDLTTAEGEIDQLQTDVTTLQTDLTTAEGEIDTLQTDVTNIETDLNGFPDELKNLTTVEIQQLENINSVTISNTKWGYLGDLNQTLTTTSTPTFAGIDLTDRIDQNYSWTTSSSKSFYYNAENGQYEDKYPAIFAMPSIVMGCDNRSNGFDMSHLRNKYFELLCPTYGTTSTNNSWIIFSTADDNSNRTVRFGSRIVSDSESFSTTITPANATQLEFYTGGSERLEITDSTTTITNTISCGDIVTSGLVDGVDIASLKSDVDGFPDALKNLTTDEIGQLENIGTSAISATEWGYLANMDQDVNTTATVYFNYVVGSSALVSDTISPETTSINLYGNTVGSGTLTVPAQLIINGTILMNPLTASRPLKLDGSKLITSALIDVSSTSDITGVLAIANGGTNSSTALNNGRIMISNSGAIVEASNLTIGENTLRLHSVGDADIWLEADTNNVTETDNPCLRMTQDGNLVMSMIGINDDNVLYFDIMDNDVIATHMSFYTGGIISNFSTGVVPTIDTPSSERMRIEEAGDIIIYNTLKLNTIESQSGGTVTIDDNVVNTGTLQVDSTLNVNTIESVSGGTVTINDNFACDDLVCDSIGIGTTANTDHLLHIASATDVNIWLEADTDNVTETDNPLIRLTQDGNRCMGLIGMDSSNAMFFDNYITTGSTTMIRFYTGGRVAGSFSAGTVPTIDTASTERLRIADDGVITTFGQLSANGNILTNSLVSRSTDTNLQLAGNGTGVVQIIDAIVLPTSGGTASQLNYYEETILDTNISGPFSSTGYTIYIIRIGKLVTLTFPGVIVTGNSTSTNIAFDDALESRFRPSSTLIHPLIVADNSVGVAGYISINTLLGSMQIYTGNGNSDPFSANTGNNGFSSFTISYYKY